MCGIFGYVAKRDKPVDMRALARVATVTMRRGPHAWGMAWVDRAGKLNHFKSTGPIVDSLGMLRLAEGSQLFIGHCRFATHGDPADNANNHPHAAGNEAFVVHNGVIHHYDHLARKHRLRLETECDSEVVAKMLAKFRGKPLARMVRACSEAMGVSPFAAMALWRDRLIATTTNGQPLHIGETRDAYWLASLPKGLPGDVREFPTGTVLEFTDKRAA